MNSYPDNSVQYLTDGNWWEEDKSGKLSRGSLINAYVQFFSEIPYELIAERSHPTAHDCITVRAAPISLTRGSASTATLPIAALPRLDGAECYIANRAKRRPCLVLGTVDQPRVDRSLVNGMAKHSTAPFVPIVPYYGVEQKGRAGYNPEFVEKIKHASYPQFMWDELPHTSKESILRFDQIQPLGTHYQSSSLLNYKLTDAAMEVIDEWLLMLINGSQGEILPIFRDIVADL